MDKIGAVLIICVTVVLIWLFSGTEGFRNRVMVRVLIIGGLLVYLIYMLFWA